MALSQGRQEVQGTYRSTSPGLDGRTQTPSAMLTRERSRWGAPALGLVQSLLMSDPVCESRISETSPCTHRHHPLTIRHTPIGMLSPRR